MGVGKAANATGPADAGPGRLHIENGRLLVDCAKGTLLEILELQLEGKKRLTAAEFLRGTSLPEGARLGGENALAGLKS